MQRVDHTMVPESLIELGHDLEAIVLNRAVRWHAEHRDIHYWKSNGRAPILTRAGRDSRRRGFTKETAHVDDGGAALARSLGGDRVTTLALASDSGHVDSGAERLRVMVYYTVEF